MAQIQTKWLADDAVNDLKIKLRNNQALRARNAADTADVDLIKLNASNEVVLPAGTKLGSSDIATLADIPSTFRIQGNWNASTNTPSLSSGVNPIDPLEYPMYIVEVAGNTALDGYSGWVAGDKLYFANGQWYKVDNNDAVSSVNGQSGAVSLNSDDISEGSTNLYFTDARAKTAAVVDSMAGNETDQAPSVDSVKSYIAGLPSSDSIRVELFALDSTDITNKYVELSLDASEVLAVMVKNAPSLFQDEDFELLNDNQISWDSLDLDGILEAGDKLTVIFKEDV
jgi:hypothetical protein